jgi:hypothetical protein
VALVLGSSYLNDEEFLSAFHTCRLPLQRFRHADHLRLAWLHVRRASLEQAELHVRSGIRKFAERNGVAHVYHETITTAWVRLIATHQESSFAEFLRVNEPRLNLELLHRFWTPELLRSEAASSQWVPPDRRKLPA